MQNIVEMLFRFFIYISVGLVMEIKFVAATKLMDGKITDEDKKLMGTVSMWMVPVYGFLILFVFEAVFNVIYSWPWWARYIVWSFSITGFEVLSGFIYDRILGFCPWNYRKSPFAICGNYTKSYLVPLWGLAGLALEKLVELLIFISPCASEFYMNSPGF